MQTKRYIGAKVKLLRDIRVQGGTVFRKGVVMRVIDSTSAGLYLRCWVRGWARECHHISKRDVEVVEWPKEES